MLRLIQEHRIRPVKSLDGVWKLAVQDGSNRCFDVLVPGVWERVPALTTFRGLADYTRMVMMEKPGNVLLRFGGVSHTARVFWDGREIAKHYNAFTAFETIVKNASAGEHVLRVAVDNRFTSESTLHIPNDYYTYGGINRPVEIHEIGDAYIERMAFTSVQEDEGAYTANVRVYVRALRDSAGLKIRACVAGAEVCADVPFMKAGERQCVSLALSVRNVLAWDVLDAHLYDLNVVLLCDNAPIDDLIDRVGFRTVCVRDEKIYLNDRAVFLKGFNRHEDHGQFGCSLSVDAMADDLQLMLDMGANSVRTCHYPNDSRFIDLCDEMGVLMWEEHHARALPGEIMRDPLFAQQCRQVNEEMITQHMNHPCIYVWGLLNECESETEFGRSVYATQIAQMRALDPSRPITFASCRHFQDICLDLVDIVSFNIYPSWYMDATTDDFSNKLISWMEENGAKGKPIIFSEFGAGAIAGFHDPLGRAKWSEERQCDILDEQLTSMLKNPRLCGAYIWQFADVRVAEEWAMRRPKTQNNKGIVDAYRRPKMSYNVVKAHYAKKQDKS